MDRRTFISGVAFGFLAVPLTSQGQQADKVYRIGVLSSFSPSETVRWNEAFRKHLQDLGWVEGKNFSIEYRYARGEDSRLSGLAAELVSLKPDIIVATITPDALAAKGATTRIPIVMASAGDPVESGLVQSLARPGGNITGLSQVALQLVGKRFELLKEIVPRLSLVAVPWNPQNQQSVISWKEAQLPARELGIALHSLPARNSHELDGALADAVRVRADALAMMPDPVFFTNRRKIAEFATNNRLPSIYHLAEYVEEGGLLAYGVDRADLFRRAAEYVDKVLKGAKPAELPIQQPTKFELAINLKTAKALGLTIPQSLLVRADEVIQ